MIFKQYYLNCLAHASYLIGDAKTGTAVVIDPQRDVDQYMADAEGNGLKIEHVILTHFHADFLAGHLELQELTGATIHLGAAAEASYSFHALTDGDTLTLGDVKLQALQTPGHTPESICLKVIDPDHSEDKPYALLTGDTLFIGDVGRPDLMASIGITATELAGQLYDSLHSQILPLPDATLIYPAHGAGSMCGKNLSTDTVSTLGEQRKFNYALQPMSKESFIAIVTAEQPEAPAYFPFDAMLNRSEHDTLPGMLQRAMQTLSLEDVLRLQNAGVQILDSRHQDRFAAGHMHGTVNISLDGKYATWAGTILDKDKDIVFISEADKEEETAIRLGRIGFDRILGHLETGMMALRDRPDLVAKSLRIDAGTLRTLIAANPPFLVDVRTPNEFENYKVPGSINIPLPQLQDRIAEIPNDCQITVYCKSGYRSSIAASLLRRQGRQDVVDLIGGMEAWMPSLTDETT